MRSSRRPDPLSPSQMLVFGHPRHFGILMAREKLACSLFITTRQLGVLVWFTIFCVASIHGQTGIESPQPKNYAVQLIGPYKLNNVLISLPAGQKILFIYWPASKGNQIVNLDQIAKIKVEHHSVRLAHPSEITEFTIGGPKEPKIYELRVEVHYENHEKFTYRFISNTAICSVSEPKRPCTEGSDNGQEVIDLANAIHKAIDALGPKR